MRSALMLRRFYCSYGPSSSSSLNPTTKKKQLVFMGSPQVSASVLDALLNASATPDSMFQVAAIVTQPPSGRDRGRKVMPSPVAQRALDRGFPSDLIFTPEKAGEEAFLSNLRALQPELCITAAYGNILPSKFLKIPPLGTVNIHPSLLPLYRGAAPVQRALQDGVKETGVSLAYTVRALDAGPVIACERFEVEDHVKAQELLEILFNHGSKLLIRELHSIFDGSARQKAEAQDDSKATHAPKEPGPKKLMKTPTSPRSVIFLPILHGTDCTTSRKSFCLPSLLDQLTPEESWLSFDQEAHVLHNKVRAFAGWPGTRAKVRVIDTNSDHHSILELKIITTRACSFKHTTGENEDDDVTFNAGALIFPCGGQSTLEVLELQLPGKKVVNATAFWNGLRGRKLKTL